SDTGKSWIVETIDFMLGGGTPPRKIPEATGYDSAWLEISVDDGRRFEFRRSLEGGGFAVVRLGNDQEVGEPTTLGSKHSSRSEDNLSAFLLKLIGLDGKQVRKNTFNEV